MKKILLTTAAALTIATTSSSYADERMEDNMFYGKVQGGMSKLDKLNTSKDKMKLKSDNSAFIGAGVGYYLMDNVRTELVYDHFLSPSYKSKGKENGGDVETKIKAKASSLMVNGFVDMFDISVVKVFAGAGVGMSKVSGKYTKKSTIAGKPATTENESIKSKTNFAYAGYLGVSSKLADDIYGELTYSYRHMGKLKKPYNKDKIKGHNVSAGIRFDM